MITVLHGDDVTASRNALSQKRENLKVSDIRYLDGKTMSDTDLVQALESNSLFGADHAVVIENCFSPLGKKLNAVKQRAKYIAGSGTEVVIWEGKPLGKTAITALGKGIRVQEFKLPVVLFQFLDSLGTKDSAQMLELLEKTIQTSQPEIIFALLVRRTRELLQLADGSSPASMSPWLKNRLTQQSKSFTIKQLLTMHKTLLSIDLGIKTGSSPLPLRASLLQIQEDPGCSASW